jgi:hypothetical protein
MDEDERLEALGLHVVGPEERPDVRDELIRVARRVKDSGCKIVGLLPASNDVGVPAIGVHLGLALCEVSGGTVAFVDANLRWPAIAEIAVGEREDREGFAFTTHWLRGSLALLTPPRVRDSGAGVPQLARVIREGFELFTHVLVDLTGFKKLGEHLAAIEMVDGVVVVGRAGRTTEGELLRLNHELPRAHNLGVLLCGAA